MKKSFLFPLVVVVPFLGACADQSVTGVDAQFSNGVSAPGTGVGAQFSIVSPEQTITTYRSTPRNNQGSCNTTNGAWTNNGGHISAANHEQCTDVTVVPGASVHVEFSATANFVQAKSGNINLNFAAVCVYVLNPETQEMECTFPSRTIQYKKNSDWTEGSGILYGDGDDGSVWMIDLSQIGHQGNAQMLARSITGLLATKVGSTEEHGAVTLSW